MHMTFYWGKDGQILFSGWPGPRTSMYILAIFIIFLVAFFVEWLIAITTQAKPCDKGIVSDLIRTLIYGLRMGLAYLLMLAVMSFNVGVFFVVVLGHAFGHMVFGSSQEEGSVDLDFFN